MLFMKIFIKKVLIRYFRPEKNDYFFIFVGITLIVICIEHQLLHSVVMTVFKPKFYIHNFLIEEADDVIENGKLVNK